MLIIPAIDIIGGNCVRLLKGDFSSVKEYSSDPFEVARGFEEAGVSRIHIVDLEGAKNGRPVNDKKILEIAQKLNVEVEVGGGIRTFEIAETYLRNGVKKVIIGSAALKDIGLLKRLVQAFGSDRILVALDLKQGKIMSDGWLKESGKSCENFLNDLKKIGIREIIFTDVDRDGTLTIPNLAFLKDLVRYGFNTILSGGVSDLRSIEAAGEFGANGVIVGKAIYEGKVDLREALQRFRSTLTKRIIPCLDVKNGRVVKGVNFKDLRDAGDPVALAKVYSDSFADELVFLDISATNEGRKTMISMVESVAKAISIPFTVGGGISSLDQIEKLLKCGADKVSINSAAVKNPALIREAAEKFGSQCIVAAVDVKKSANSWGVFVNAGDVDAGIDALEWVSSLEKMGAGEILITSMDRDGTKSGYDLELLKELSDRLNIPVIASGGAGSLKDMEDAFLIGGADAVLVASLFHNKEISIAEAKKYLASKNILIRSI